MKKLFYSMLFLLVGFCLEAGGGWPQAKGKGYAKLAAWWLIADQHYTDAGIIDPNITMGVFNNNIYAEYGVTDRLTTVLYFPFFSRNFMNNIISGTTGELLVKGEAINGMGDTDVTLKYALSPPGKSIAISAGLTFGLPLGTDKAGTQENLQLGDGEFNQLLQLDAGTGFQLNGIPMYANIYLGYNNRTEGYSDEIRYGLELGGTFLKNKLGLTLRLAAVESRKNGDTAATTNATSIFSNNAEYTSIGAELYYNITEEWGLSTSLAGAVRGEIIFARPSYSFGVFTKF